MSNSKALRACLLVLVFAFLFAGRESLAQTLPGDADGNGIVDRRDIELITAARNTPASGPSDPRDVNKDGVIDAVDVRLAINLCTNPNCALPSAVLTVDNSPTLIELLVGQSANVSTNFTYVTTDTVNRSVNTSQAIGGGGGITVTPALAAGFTANSNRSEVTNQTVHAILPGTYTITSTGFIPALGVTASAVVTVVVKTSADALVLNAPAFYPPAVEPNQTTALVVSTAVSGFDPDSPPIVQLTNGTMTPLADDGTGGDLVAADGIYTATLSINSAGMLPGQCWSYKAVSGTVESLVSQLCVSSLPLAVTPSDLSAPITEAGTGLLVVKNEILVLFRPGTTEAQIAQTAAEVGAQIAGYHPVVLAALLRFSTPFSGWPGLASMIATLKAKPPVLDAVPNHIGATSEVTPNDTHYGLLWNMQKIRADEAWTIARGGTTVAVLDTGVDYNHVDLSGRVINGFDWGDFDTNPIDVHSHGTHVAGTVAAKANNSTGVTGVSWNSSILNVKVLRNTGSGTNSALIWGTWEAVARGARIINMSLQNFGSGVCPMINAGRALGRLIVAAAGNMSSSTINYPSGCGGAIAVGNTTSTDGRSGTSNFGAWVDMAAPGSSIYSTTPGNTYGYKSGTSMASPLVAGAMAVLLSRQPGLSADQVETRFKRTAVPLPGLQLGAGRIDLWEAVFNGSFEEADMALWTRVGTANSVTALGPLAPQHRKRMAFVSSGPAGDSIFGSLTQVFTIQPGVSSFKFRFKYTFVTEEYPEWVSRGFNDSFQITMQAPSGTTTVLATETVNGSAFGLVGGINFPGGDTTVGWTGWKERFVTVPVTAGPGRYRIFITDNGDDIYDSVVLVDAIANK